MLAIFKIFGCKILSSIGSAIVSKMVSGFTAGLRNCQLGLLVDLAGVGGWGTT